MSSDSVFQNVSQGNPEASFLNRTHAHRGRPKATYSFQLSLPIPGPSANYFTFPYQQWVFYLKCFTNCFVFVKGCQADSCDFHFHRRHLNDENDFGRHHQGNGFDAGLCVLTVRLLVRMNVVFIPWGTGNDIMPLCACCFTFSF